MHRESECGISYRISSNNSRGNYFFFHIKRGRLFEGRRLIEILLTGSLALNILFYYHIKKTEHGLFKCSKFGSLINFQTWIVTDQFCWLIPLQLDREGIKDREGCGGQLCEGGD